MGAVGCHTFFSTPPPLAAPMANGQRRANGKNLRPPFYGQLVTLGNPIPSHRGDATSLRPPICGEGVRGGGNAARSRRRQQSGGRVSKRQQPTHRSADNHMIRSRPQLEPWGNFGTLWRRIKCYQGKSRRRLCVRPPSLRPVPRSEQLPAERQWQSPRPDHLSSLALPGRPSSEKDMQLRRSGDFY